MGPAPRGAGAPVGDRAPGADRVGRRLLGFDDRELVRELAGSTSARRQLGDLDRPHPLERRSLGLQQRVHPGDGAGLGGHHVGARLVADLEPGEAGRRLRGLGPGHRGHVHDRLLLPLGQVQVLEAVEEVREPVGLEHHGDDVLRLGLVLADELAREELTGPIKPGHQHPQERTLARDRALRPRERGPGGAKPGLHGRLALGHQRDLAVESGDQL
jgi:hypothetical protein